MKKYIINMSEEEFKEFSKGCTAEQVKTMQEMRFFNKLFTDSSFYKAVEKAIGEVAYEELRAK